MATALEIASAYGTELRRGSIVLGVLSRLNTPKYGYSLVQELGQYGLIVEPGTLYPLLRRLESQGLLISEWETDGSKPRKYYSMSVTGSEVYDLLKADWKDMIFSLNNMISED
ncbi:MAG: PadR family transcriptional regulator [Eubacteriales bacterium]|nr:PadR family transcriptional regulator [Eubacteriales bacterium]MDD4327901.1 PadR family transcriptional regulator [Eubacteriales bacterium]MDD4717742.1 PadR family transcriptional regulator [Eubacteriales bacterium]NCU25420.1 PadR family transcriptional regulator [Candidatus Nomurabacteria bacterium]